MMVATRRMSIIEITDTCGHATANCVTHCSLPTETTAPNALFIVIHDSKMLDKGRDRGVIFPVPKRRASPSACLRQQRGREDSSSAPPARFYRCRRHHDPDRDGTGPALLPRFPLRRSPPRANGYVPSRGAGLHTPPAGIAHRI